MLAEQRLEIWINIIHKQISIEKILHSCVSAYSGCQSWSRAVQKAERGF